MLSHIQSALCRGGFRNLPLQDPFCPKSKGEIRPPVHRICAKSAHGLYWSMIQQRLLKQCPLDKLSLTPLFSMTHVTGERGVGELF